MARYFIRAVLAVLFIVPAISAMLGWLPCRADLSWLIMLSFTMVTIAIWDRLELWLDRTNDPLVASLIHSSLFISLLATTVLVPFAVLVTGFDWLVITLAGLGLALSATVVSALRLRYW